MKNYIYSFLLLFLPLFATAQIKWYNPLEGDIPNVQGRAWNSEIGKSFHRLPIRAKANVRGVVWNLSTNSSGLHIDFYSNAPEIIIKYTVSASISQWNMPAIACSGVDMYATDSHGVTDWCACPSNFNFGKNRGDTILFHYKGLDYHNNHKEGSQYQLFLPLLNEVTSLSIGVPDSSLFKFAPLSSEKPIVVYGTSIAQGIAASRPAMSWSNQVARKLDSPIVNLGFSGNALMEPAIFDLMSEVKSQLYIIDCMPNMYPSHDSIYARTINGVAKLRAKSNTPILLVENDGYMYGTTNRAIENECTVTNVELRRAYDKLIADSVKGLYYLSKEEIGITPDAQVDGWHPSDLGMTEYANAYVNKINDILGRNVLPIFEPCSQRREPHNYEWRERHEAVVKRNATENPEVLMIGNSITHFWGGYPEHRTQNGKKSWKKLFGKKSVTNMGFGWDRIENVVWRIYHGELDNCSPKHIFMMIGTNNLEKNSNEEIVSGIIELSKLIRSHQPETKLHIVKIFPRKDQEERIASLNTLLEETLIKDELTDIVDCTSALLKNDGSGKIDESLFSDGLHPNEKGYDRISTILSPYVK
jgi:hypothetical protein